MKVGQRTQSLTWRALESVLARREWSRRAAMTVARYLVLGLAAQAVGILALAMGALRVGQVLASWPASLVFHVIPKAAVESAGEAGVFYIGLASGCAFWMCVAYLTCWGVSRVRRGSGAEGMSV